jgi:hypothetical protein
LFNTLSKLRGRQIERRIAAMDYQLAEAASDRRRLLYAVTTETVREVKIRETRRPSDERIVIEHVHVVMAGPGTTSLESLKGGHPRGEDGPNVFVEKRIIDLEIVAVGVGIGGWRHATQKAVTLWSNIDTGRMYQQRAAANFVLAREGENHALLVMDWNVEVDGTRDRLAAGTSGVDDGAARDARPVVQQYRRDTVARPFDAGRCR